MVVCEAIYVFDKFGKMVVCIPHALFAVIKSTAVRQIRLHAEIGLTDDGIPGTITL